MPADRVRFLLEELHGHAIGLRQKWTLYQELYGNRKRVEVMRAAAHVSFGILQPVIWESIFVAVARFIDPPRVSGKDTTSLEQLIKNIPPGNDDLSKELTRCLATLRVECENIKQWRHNSIAHASLEVALMEKNLDGVTIRSVHQAVNGIESFLLKVGDHFYPSESWSFQGEPVDADNLMFLLEEGLKVHPPLNFPLTGI